MTIQIDEILARHGADSRRFKASGLQDRESVLLQAHRDRADLLCEIAHLTKSPRAAPTQDDPLGQRPLTIPWSAWDWLMGQGPDDKGVWFGDGPRREIGQYWWRPIFRRLCGVTLPGPDDCWVEQTAPTRRQTVVLEPKGEPKPAETDHALMRHAAMVGGDTAWFERNGRELNKLRRGSDY